MTPSLPALLLATLAAAGYGLLAWTGISVALLALRGQLASALEGVQVVGIAIGLILATIGLVRAIGTPTQPRRAWRSLTQWRNSWPAREAALGLVTTLTGLAAAAVLLAVGPGETRTAAMACLGIVLALGAMGTVTCHAMVHVAMTPVPAWRHPLVIPIFLLASLACGIGLLFAVISGMLGGTGQSMMLVTVAVLGGLLLALQALYWYELTKPPKRGGVPLVPARSVPVARSPLHDAARRNLPALRIATAAGILLVPLLALALVASQLVAAVPALLLATLGLLAGALAGRWLFFAEARQLPASTFG